MKLAGKTAIVTGAGKGIGQAISLRLAREGARVVVSDIDDEAVAGVVAEIRASGGEALPYHCDVLDLEQIESLVEFTITHFDQVDILVNNAGGAIVAGEKRPLYDSSEESIIRMLGINLMGTVWCTRAVVGHMKERRTGTILNMSSVAGMQGGTPAMYATAKGAIISFTKSIAFEMAQFGVTVNCIAPWAIATREGPSLPTRIGRKGTAEDVANLSAFLVSEEASFITGSNYVMDGGWKSGH
jgi:NAD(P)-dependent dehydrogenase (short-subunit alcohol dehydrogenase family)